MHRLSPETMARLQSQASNDPTWAELLQRIMALTLDNPTAFASQPYANRADAIMEAVVPSRKNPTHEKVLTIVNALVETMAIRPDEAGQMYDALLNRVSRYNSMNVQTNLDRLSSDVRNVISAKERTAANNLGSLSALNAFLSTLPANVDRGQENYTAFISALRLLVTEVPSTDVYQSGPKYYLQTTRNGSQTVCLTDAFENLKNLWGVNAPVAERNSISSLLTPNTRLLLLLVSPFVDGVHMSRSSYIGYLLTLYRETLGQTTLNERTYEEITNVSRAIGDDDAANLQATLNFLLTNRQKRIPKEYELTEAEEKIVRYVQQAVSMHIMAGTSPTDALDETARNFEPSFYSAHRPFINKLMDYLHRAAAIAPNYFLNAVLNPKWRPSEGFFTGVYDFPEGPNEDYSWDDEPALRAEAGPLRVATPKSENERPRSLSSLELSLDNLIRSRHPSVQSIRHPSSLAPSVDSLNEEIVRKSIRTRPLDMNFNYLSRVKNSNEKSEIDNLTDRFANIKTHKQEMKETEDEEEDWRKDRFLKFEGSGMGGGNMFSHLMPKGIGRM